MPLERVYALKVGVNARQEALMSLKEGVGRFGWSYVETADLRELKRRIEDDGIDTLSEAERDCYQAFLLELRPDDYVVYINVPTYGECTLARVTSEYFWKWTDGDFNHRFQVDPASVYTFDRNDAAVHPALNARLKLQGRWWHIYAITEFEQLLESIKNGTLGQHVTQAHRFALLSEEIRPHVLEITRRIHHTHPNYSLEKLVSEILEGMPGIREVQLQGGAGDHGADLLATVEEPHPITGHPRQTTFVIQVKSFDGEHSDLRAISDIRRAFEKYPEASEGVIVSTAATVTEDFEEALSKLRSEAGKPVHLLIGPDVAAFVLKNGWELLRYEDHTTQVDQGS